MIELTYDQAVSFLREAVTEKGENYIYDPPKRLVGAPRCHYAHDGEPSCLVGHVLAKAGVPVKEMEWRRVSPGRYSVEDARKVLDRLKRDGVLRVDKRTAIMLAEAQRHQDIGVSWGRAISEALRAASE